MAYVQQVCDGYSKKTLMGNFYQERLYPQQPFRTQQQKKARNKDQGITCFDNTGFQRALPRLSRRTKWQTTSRIVLDDGIKIQNTVMKQDYPNGEQQHARQVMIRPLDKSSGGIKSTTLHPNSQIKENQKNYHMLDTKVIGQLLNQRKVHNYQSDFCSTLIQHPKNQKFTNYTSVYKQSYSQPNTINNRTRTLSQINPSKTSAGNFNPTPQQSVKPITNLTGELNKQTGDKKQLTEIQRSWVPPRDKAVSYTMGKTSNDFKKANIPVNDIQTSINMNIGIQNIHPKNVGDNYFRHVRQDVTIQPNKTLCSRP